MVFSEVPIIIPAYIEVEGNIFDNCESGISIWKSHDDVFIRNNHFQNTEMVYL